MNRWRVTLIVTDKGYTRALGTTPDGKFGCAPYEKRHLDSSELVEAFMDHGIQCELGTGLRIESATVAPVSDEPSCP